MTWHGLSCFRIQADGVTLLTDPLFSGSGLRGPRMAANLIAVTDRTAAGKLDLPAGVGTPRLIGGPGEYEVAGVLVEGIALPRGGRHTGYRATIDGLSVVTLGMLPTPPPPEELAALTGCDLLIIPVGGGPVLSAAQAAQLINLLEPRVVIPCAYRLPALTVKLDPLDKFCREIGICPAEALPKLRMTRKDLPTEEMRVVVLAKA